MEEEKVENKAYRNYIWFLLIILVVFAFFTIRTLLESNNSFYVGNEKTIFVVLSAVIGTIAYAGIYVLGKAIFALISGFKIIDLNILVLRFYKDNNKLKVDFVFPEGWGGNVHVIPKKEDDKVKPILFHFGGAIFSIAIALLASIISMMIDKKIGYTISVSSLFGIIILIANLMPLYLDSINDGFSIRLLVSKDNKKAYLDNLRQKASLNYQIGELQDYIYDNYKNIFQAESLIYRYYYFMNKKDFTNAEEVCDKLLKYRHFVSSETVSLFEANKMYFYLLANNDEKCYDYYYSLDKTYRNYIISHENYETVKTAILLAAKVEKTYDLYEYILHYENSLKNKYKLSRVKYEEELVQSSKEKAYQIFPDWKD